MSDLAGKKLGVLLTVKPTDIRYAAAVRVIQGALEAGVRVYIYCIDDGVLCVAEPVIQEFKARGVSLYGCAYGAGRRKVALTEQAAWSGLTVLSDIIGSTDRFLSF